MLRLAFLFPCSFFHLQSVVYTDISIYLSTYLSIYLSIYKLLYLWPLQHTRTYIYVYIVYHIYALWSPASSRLFLVLSFGRLRGGDLVPDHPHHRPAGQLLPEPRAPRGADHRGGHGQAPLRPGAAEDGGEGPLHLGQGTGFNGPNIHTHTQVYIYIYMLYIDVGSNADLFNWVSFFV